MRRRWHALTVSAGNVILRVVERTLGASTPVRLMHGFAVVHYGPEAVGAEVFGKVSEALALIAETDLRRYARMQTDLRQIVVMESRNRVRFVLCALAAVRVETRDVSKFKGPCPYWNSNTHWDTRARSPCRIG
jgi:hypothetical protein